MKITSTDISDVLLIEPTVYRDDRGFFFESFNQRDFNEATQTSYVFVQDNHSHSLKGVLRGLHYQVVRPQGKLVRVIQGMAFDVAVDLRQNSKTFGKWVGIVLDGRSNKQLWIPPGFAHGFLVLSESADFVYKTTDYYSPENERCIAWNDPELSIEWPLVGKPFILSEKDQRGVSFAASEKLAILN